MAAINTINRHSASPFNYVIPTSKKFDIPFNYTIILPDDLSLIPGTSFKNLPITPRKVAENKPALGPLVLSGVDLITDFTGYVSKSFDGAKIIYGTESKVALSALELNSIFGLVKGSLNVKAGIREAKQADKISDTAGCALAATKVLVGGAQVSGASCFIPMRALSIAGLVTASKVCASIAAVLGKMGSSAFTIASIFAAISHSIRLNEQRCFRQKLNEILTEPNLTEEARYVLALDHLKKLVTISPEEKAAIGDKYRHLNPPKKVEKTAKKERQLLAKKEGYLKRLTGGDCVNQIRAPSQVAAKEVVETVRAKSREKVILSSIAMVLLVIGISLAVASFFVNPIGLMVVAAIGITTTLCWVLLDAYSLSKNYKESDPGRYDKIWIFASTTLAVITVSVAFFFSAGIAPIIAAAVVGAIWLGVNITTYVRIREFEKKKALAASV